MGCLSSRSEIGRTDALNENGLTVDSSMVAFRRKRTMKKHAFVPFIRRCAEEE